MRAAAVIASLVLASCRAPSSTVVEIPSLVVLPLENVSADPEDSDYLAQGISRAVITKLTQAGVRVTPWDTARRYAGERVDAVARELRVDAVLVGTFELVGDRMLTTLSLVDAKSGLQSWADEFEEPFEDVFDVQRRIALGAAKSLKQELSGDEETALAAPESRSAEAYDQYMQGAHLFQQGDEESTEIAFHYFNRALSIDPELSEAHMALGAVHYARYVFGWGGRDSLESAERSYTRALELDPENLRARRGLIFLSYFLGRSELARAQGELAAQYGRSDDPELALTLLNAYAFGMRPERLPPLRRELRELDLIDAEVLYALVLHSWGMENDVALEAGTLYLEQFGEDPEIREFLAFTHVLLGNLDEARRHYHRGLELIESDGLVEPMLWAGFLYDHLGDTARAQELWRTGLARIAPRAAAHPDNLDARVFEACFRGLTGDPPFLLAATDEILASGANGWVLEVLAVVLAALEHETRAVEVLRTMSERGLPDAYWRLLFDVAFVPRDGTPFDSFAEEIEAELAIVREKY